MVGSVMTVGSGSTGYSVFADLDASGGIDSTDLVHVRRNLLAQLPGAEPTGALILGAPRTRGIIDPGRSSCCEGRDVVPVL